MVGVKEQDYFPNKEPFGKWSHTVDFYVATRDALYSPEKLQDFMMNLVPKGLTPFPIDEFMELDGGLFLGKLYFDENIPNLELKDILKKRIKIGGNPFYKRRIWVRPFPNERLARDVSESKTLYQSRITREELKRYNLDIFDDSLEKMVS